MSCCYRLRARLACNRIAAPPCRSSVKAVSRVHSLSEYLTALPCTASQEERVYWYGHVEACGSGLLLRGLNFSTAWCTMRLISVGLNSTNSRPSYLSQGDSEVLFNHLDLKQTVHFETAVTYLTWRLQGQTERSSWPRCGQNRSKVMSQVKDQITPSRATARFCSTTLRQSTLRRLLLT